MNKLPKKPKSKLSGFYELIPDPKDDTQWLVRLKKHPWTGVVYKYLKFRLKEDSPNDRLICQFDYDIITEMLPKRFKKQKFTDEQGKEFVALIGDIVIELVQEHYNNTSEEQNDNS